MASYRVYDMTPYTRGAQADRTTVFWGYEVKWPHLVVSFGGAIIGLLLALMLSDILGQYSPFLVPMCIGGALWLFIGQSEKGLRLRNWQRIKDNKMSRTGQFMLSGRPIDPASSPVRVIRTVALPVERKASTSIDVDDLIA